VLHPILAVFQQEHAVLHCVTPCQVLVGTQFNFLV